MCVSVFAKLLTFFQVFVVRAMSAFFNGLKLILLTALISSLSVTAFADDDDDDEDSDEISFSYIDDVRDSLSPSMDELDLRLQPFDFDLMGDMRDPHSGTLVFATTDVSIPGNSDLPVAIRRMAKGGTSSDFAKYSEDGADDVFFGDWTLDVPNISFVDLGEGAETLGVGQRVYCGLGENGTSINAIGSGGYKLNIPGAGSQTLLDYYEGPEADNALPNSFAPFHRDGNKRTNGYYITRHTENDWLAGCDGQGSSGGTLVVRSPEGTKYRMDRLITTAVQRNTTNLAVQTGEIHDNPINVVNKIDLLDIQKAKAVKRVFYATEVTDVHGNWVKYDYNNAGQLTRIHSNDGRAITISYVPNTRNISKVTANGRVWKYQYRKIAKRVSEKYISSPPDRNGRVRFADRTVTKHELSLHKVIQPDGTYWEYDIRDLTHYGHRRPDVVGDFNDRSRHVINRANHIDPSTRSFAPIFVSNIDIERVYTEGNGNISVKHPYGTRANYLLGSINLKRDLEAYKNPFSTGVFHRTVLRKTISEPSLPTSTWTYQIHGKGHITTTRPDGSKETQWCTPDGFLEGKLERVEIRGSNNALLERRDYTYTDRYYTGHTFRGEDDEEFYEPPRIHRTTGRLIHDGASYDAELSEVKITRDGDTFTTKYAYNLDQNSASYSYGRRIQTQRSSSVSTSPRITDTVYEHNKSKWILGLPKKVTQNNVEKATYTYDSSGRVTAETRYGAPYKTYAYHGLAVSKGALYWAKDALGRTTTYLSYKRGTPQIVKRPDNKYQYQYVDNNGWRTSTRDALGRTTKYTHDTMGRIKTIDPHGNFWSVTAINYHFPGTGGASQTITRGSSLTTITYDSMFRTVLERTQALDTGWSSYVNTKYDTMGRVKFTSQPSTSSSERNGVDTTFDGLGRITQSRENVAPFATTRNTYHQGHRRRVTDPSGAWTDYYSYGYDGPNNNDYSAMLQYDKSSTLLRNTFIHKDARGQLNRIDQFGDLGGKFANGNQYFYYDDQKRLCRHYVPEHGATIYQYDAADQLIAYAKGRPNQGCGNPGNIPAKVSLTYDTLGRVTKTDFNHGGTPDILKTYDANSNVKTVNRGRVNWSYVYNDDDLLTAETLKLDGRTFQMNYVYNSEGQLIRRRLPTNRWVDYTLDGLGRKTDVKSAVVTLASNTNYHASGAVTAMTYGNGQTFTQTLNNRLLPNRMRSVKGRTVALDLAYLYDPRGKITRMTDRQNGNNTRNYKYDGLGQVIEAKAPFWGTASYKYDSLGNIRQKKVGARTVDLIYDTKNRLTRSIDTGETKTRWIAYDARGNTSALGSLRFSYDFADQPVRVTGAANGVNGAAGATNGSYTYDGNLKRVKSVVNGKTIYNVYDASGALVHVHELTGNKKTDYISGPMGSLARYTNNVVTYLHKDHLGSPRATTSGAGAINGWSTYTPFGEEWSAKLPNDQAGFTGHIKDSATGLNYMQARYYDPVIGRFLSVDPTTFVDTGNPSYFNRYRYCANDPINCTDPTGRDDSDQTQPGDDNQSDDDQDDPLVVDGTVVEGPKQEDKDNSNSITDGQSIRDFLSENPLDGTNDPSQLVGVVFVDESRTVIEFKTDPTTKAITTNHVPVRTITAGNASGINVLGKALARQIGALTPGPSGPAGSAITTGAKAGTAIHNSRPVDDKK